MVYYIEYAKVSPAVLDMVVYTVCPIAYVMNYPVEGTDDIFEAVVCFWEEPTTLDKCKVEKALAPYV